MASPFTERDIGWAHRALIVKPSSLGDIVHALPAVHLLKDAWPHIRFSWVVNEEFAPMLEGNPDLGEIIRFPRSSFRGLRGAWQFRQWLRELRGLVRADVAFDFQGLLRSGLMSRASGARLTVGMDDSREGARLFHQLRVPVDADAHAVARCVAVSQAFGATVDAPLDFALPTGTCPAALTMPPRDYIVIHPFSRGEGKSMPVPVLTRLCESLSPLPVFLVGRCAPAMTTVTWPAHVQSLLNQTTLPELVWLMREADAIISVDSGPMHIAAALTHRVLGLHTWSDPRKVGPVNPLASVWKAGHVMACRNLDPGICASAGRTFDLRDVPSWVDWAASALGM